MTTQSVQVKLELGHRATFRDKPTPQGFTHDWIVFVRGPGNESSIQHFVDKVVFQLHESFPKARRVVKDYPFQVAESGYAGFLMPIEVYFKNKEEPKKVIFQYDLFLHLAGQPPVNHIRCEKLTFNNPTEDFRRKLIKAGGVGILEPDGSPSHSADKPTALSTYKPHSSVTSIQYKFKTEPDVKYCSTSGKPQKPIKEHQEVKTAWKEPKAASKGPKSASKEPKSASKEPKSASKESKSTSKEPKSASKDLKSTPKEPKSNSKVAQKPSGKRPPSSSPPPSSSGSSSSQDGTKKRKKSTSAKEKNGSSKQGTSDKSSDKQSSGEKSKGKNKSSKSKSSVKQSSKRDDNELFTPEIVVKRRNSKKEPPKELPPFEAELSTGENDDDDMDVPSPSSSISFSSLPRGGGKGALNTLMHEIDENDDDFDDQDIVTPFQTDFSNHHTVSNNIDRDYEDNSSRSSSVEREKEREKEKERGKEKGKSKEKGTNSRKGSSSNGPKKSSKSERKSRNSESSSKQKSQTQSNHDYLTELVLLHRKLMSLRNREQIQRIVDLIGDTDHFQISDNSFDFDLCSLDKTTVKKLQECVAPL